MSGQRSSEHLRYGVLDNCLGLIDVCSQECLCCLVASAKNRVEDCALNNAVIAALIAAAADRKQLVDDASAKRAVAELTRE